LAAQKESTGSMFSEYGGTPLYMSPERLNDKKYSFNSDVW